MFLEALFHVRRNAAGSTAAVPQTPEQFAMRTMD